MSEKRKYIGINQRIQFEVLDAAIHEYLLSGEVSRDHVIAHIQQFTKGVNRAFKEASYVMLIFKRQTKVLTWLSQRLSAEQYISLPLHEKQSVIISLVTLTFPISYDLINVLAGVFKVQETINRETIIQKMSLIYGSNKTLFIAIEALLPMLIENGRVQRVKLGLYSIGQIKYVVSPLISELLIYTDIKQSYSKSLLVDDLTHRNFYTLFPYTINKETKFSIVKLSDSMVGQGYLTV